MPVPVVAAPVLAPAAAAAASGIGEALGTAAAVAGAAAAIQFLPRGVPGPPLDQQGNIDAGRLLGQVADALGQFWGWLNQQGHNIVLPKPGGVTPSVTGSYSVNGRTRIQWAQTTHGYAFMQSKPDGFDCIVQPGTVTLQGGEATVTAITGFSYRLPYMGACGPKAAVCDVNVVGMPRAVEIPAVYYDSFPGDAVNWSWKPLTLTPLDPGPTEDAVKLLGGQSDPLIPNLVPPGNFIPDQPERREPLAPPIPFTPGTAPAPQPPSEPLPAEPGTGPGGDPLRRGVPGIAPAPAGGPRPLLPPGQGPVERGDAGAGTQGRPGVRPARPILPDGRPQPPAAEPVPQIPPGQTNIGTIVIPGQGPAPQPTLQGIATELGKLERKMEIQLLRPQPEIPEPPDLSQLEQLLELLSDQHQGGQYQLVGVCEPGAGGGGQPVRSATWAAGSGALALLSKKLDALAQLIQHHKDLRQPICRQKASGEEVTVIFEEL